MTDGQIKHMVDRFLAWKLPANFNPDNGISFEPEFNAEWNAKHGRPPQRREPVGTNLLDYKQAETMVRHMVEGIPHPAPAKPIAAEPGEVEREDLLARIDAEVERITGWHPAKDILRDCRRALTATEPRTAGEGALADERTIRELGFAIKDAVKEAWPMEKRDRVARAALKCIALRQPSTDRESVIEECAKVALQYARNAYDEGLSEDVVTARFHVANDIFNAIRGLKASSKGGDHG